MSKIKLLVENGIDFPDAVKASLGMSIRDFAKKHDVPETAVSMVINGSTPSPYEPTREALATELDVDRLWLDEQIERQRAAVAA